MEEKLSVCLINDSFPPLIDGVANTVMNYAKVINESHGKAVVAVPYYPKAEDSAFPYKIVRFPSINTERLIDYRAGYPFSYETLEKIKQENINIIHTHCPFAATVLARTLREPIDAPIIFTYHTKFDVDVERAVGKGYLKDKIIRGIVKNIEACDEVWVVSEGAGKNLENLGYKGEYIVMPNGVDIPKGKVPEEKIKELSEKFSLPENLPVFLFVGRMAWYKGLDIILEGLAKLKESGEDFKMVFVGGGLDFDEVVKYSKELGLFENCVFTGPIHNRETIRAFYSRADLFLFPSVYDTNGLVVREAAACALPSILVEKSCAAEGIFDCETGFLIQNSAESLGEKLIFLSKNRELIKTVGENAMDKIYLSWEDSVANAAKRYEVVLKNYRDGKFERKQTFEDEWLDAEGEFLNYIAEAKRKTKSVGAGVYKGSIKAAKSFNKRRIRLKKTIIKKLRRYL